MGSPVSSSCNFGRERDTDPHRDTSCPGLEFDNSRLNIHYESPLVREKLFFVVSVARRPGKAYTDAMEAAYSGIIWPKQEPMKKRITDITWGWEVEIVDVGSFDDPNAQMPGRRYYTFVDQDGDPLPPELETQLQSAVERAELDKELITRLIAEHNDDGEMVPHITQVDIEHAPWCGYPTAEPRTYPCTCKSPSLFSNGCLWWCPCCQKPRSDQYQSTCDECAKHTHRVHDKAPFSPISLRDAEVVLQDHLHSDSSERSALST